MPLLLYSRSLGSHTVTGLLTREAIEPRQLADQDVTLMFTDMNLTLTEICELTRTAYRSWGVRSFTLERVDQSRRSLEAPTIVVTEHDVILR